MSVQHERNLLFRAQNIRERERGIEADPRKVTAIINIKFIPSYSEITAPLRVLLEKGSAWSFDEPQETAIN